MNFTDDVRDDEIAAVKAEHTAALEAIKQEEHRRARLLFWKAGGLMPTCAASGPLEKVPGWYLGSSGFVVKLKDEHSWEPSFEFSYMVSGGSFTRFEATRGAMEEKLVQLRDALCELIGDSQMHRMWVIQGELGKRFAKFVDGGIVEQVDDLNEATRFASRVDAEARLISEGFKEYWPTAVTARYWFAGRAP